MKTIQIARALIGACFVTAVFAIPASELAGAKTPPPTPTVVVEPTHLPRTFTGGIVHVEFSLDESGRPRDIRLPAVHDASLKMPVLKAFSQWQFAPSQNGASFQSKRFVLPLEVKPQG
jgi:hypothetical protein